MNKKNILFVTIATLAAATAGHAADGTWISTAGGNWDDATTAPWAGGFVAGGAGFTANFTSDIAATTAVTLTASRDIGSLVFSDNGASGSAWSLGNSGGAVLTLTGGTPTITAITAATISAPLTAAGGFTKAGAGALTLTGTAGGIAGTIDIAAGSLLTTLERIGTATLNANSSYGAAYASAGTPFLRITNTTNQVMTNSLIVAAPASAAYYGIQKSGTGSSLDLAGTISGGNANSVLQLDTATGGDSTTSFILSGNNSVAGQIRLNRGRLTLANANALGSALLFLQTNANATDGSLSFSGITSVANSVIIGTTTNQWINTGAATITLPGVVSSATSASGGFSKMGAGTLSLTGANTYNGSATTVADGALSVSGSGRLNATAYTGTLTLTAATSVFDYASSTTQTLSGVVSGLGNVTKAGASVLIFSNTANTFSGGATVNGGELRAQVATPAAGTFTTLGTGALTVNSGGTLRFMAGSTANAYSYANAINLNSAALVFEDGNHTLTGDIALTGSNAVNGVWGGKNLTFAGVVSGAGSLTKGNTAAQDTTLILANSNSYAGGTTIDDGTVAVGSNTALGSGNVTVNATAAFGAAYASGGTPFLRSAVSGLIVANNIALPSAAGYYALQSGTAAGGVVEWSGVISGGGAGVVLQIDTPNSGDATSTATLSGSNTFAGQIRLNRGRLAMSNANALGTAALYLATNANAASGNLVFNGVTSVPNDIVIGTTANQWIDSGAASVSISGVVSSATAGVGGLSKMGSGTLIFTNVNTYSGNTVVGAGTLSLADNAQFKFAIGATGVNNAITGTGALTLDGDFSFDLATAGGTLGDTWQIVANSTLSETYSPTFSVFAGATLFTDNGNDTWSFTNGSGIEYTFAEATGALAVTAVPEPGAAISLLAGLGVLLGLRRRRA